MDFAANFLVSHYPMLGWVIFLGIVGRVGWQASRLFSKFETFFQKLERIDDIENTLEKVATNHLPHLEIAIDSMRKEVVEELKGLRSELFQILLHRDHE